MSRLGPPLPTWSPPHPTARAMASSDAPSARSGPDPGSFPGPYPAPFERVPSRWRRSVTPAHVDALRREDGASWTTSSRAAVRPRAATAARGRPRSARRPGGSPPPASCAPIARTSRTPRCASPRLAPTNPHPLPLSWAPRRTDFPTRRIPSPSAPPGRAPPLLQTERVRDGPARVGRPRAPPRARRSLRRLRRRPRRRAPSPRRRLRSPPPTPRRRLRRTRCRVSFPATPREPSNCNTTAAAVGVSRYTTITPARRRAAR